MTKKLIKELVEASITKDKLDPEKVEMIARRLDRGNLKLYLRALKIYAARNSVTITTAKPVSKDLQKTLVQHLKAKDVNFRVDEERLFGVEIIDGDMVYDNTLRKTFDEVINFVENS